jgi:hypothetical protein
MSTEGKPRVLEKASNRDATGPGSQRIQEGVKQTSEGGVARGAQGERNTFAKSQGANNESKTKENPGGDSA